MSFQWEDTTKLNLTSFIILMRPISTLWLLFDGYWLCLRFLSSIKFSFRSLLSMGLSVLLIISLSNSLIHDMYWHTQCMTLSLWIYLRLSATKKSWNFDYVCFRISIRYIFHMISKITKNVSNVSKISLMHTSMVSENSIGHKSLPIETVTGH